MDEGEAEKEKGVKTVRHTDDVTKRLGRYGGKQKERLNGGKNEK